MIPQTQPRKSRNSSKVNLLIALIFHGLIVLFAVYFAAREGVLGKDVKKIAISMMKEKPPDKPKEPEKPKEELPREETPKLSVAPVMTAAKEVGHPASATPGQTMAPAVAPPAADLAAFDVEGGRTVVSSADPLQVYKELVENSLRARWDRPSDLDDLLYEAEVEVTVDSSGNIGSPVWKKGSGNKRWDDSVRQAVAATESLSLPPPKDFPSRITVRFDVQSMQNSLQ
jgi:TonB family protein